MVCIALVLCSLTEVNELLKFSFFLVKINKSKFPGHVGKFENVDAHFPGNVSKARATVKCISEM